MSKYAGKILFEQFKEQFIREHVDEFDDRDWYNTARCQKLSETFMRQISNYLTRDIWKEMSKFQDMSTNFRREMFIKRK